MAHIEVSFTEHHSLEEKVVENGGGMHHNFPGTTVLVGSGLLYLIY